MAAFGEIEHGLRCLSNTAMAIEAEARGIDCQAGIGVGVGVGVSNKLMDWSKKMSDASTYIRVNLYRTRGGLGGLRMEGEP